MHRPINSDIFLRDEHMISRILIDCWQRIAKNLFATRILYGIPCPDSSHDYLVNSCAFFETNAEHRQKKTSSLPNHRRLHTFINRFRNCNQFIENFIEIRSGILFTKNKI